MNKYVKSALIIFASLILALFLIERSCSSPDAKHFELKGLFQAHKEKTEKEKQEAQKLELERKAEIERKEAEISELKDRILDLEEDRREYQKKDTEKASKIKELEAERKKLEDPAAVIKNQDLQISEWKNRFWNEREDKENVIKQRDFWARVAFKEQAKFQTEQKISQSLRDQLKREEGLRILAEELNKQNEKRFNRLKFGSTIKTVLIIGAAVAGGYVIYKEVK